MSTFNISGQLDAKVKRYDGSAREFEYSDTKTKLNQSQQEASFSDDLKKAEGSYHEAEDSYHQAEGSYHQAEGSQKETNLASDTDQQTNVGQIDPSFSIHAASQKVIDLKVDSDRIQQNVLSEKSTNNSSFLFLNTKKLSSPALSLNTESYQTVFSTDQSSHDSEDALLGMSFKQDMALSRNKVLIESSNNLVKIKKNGLELVSDQLASKLKLGIHDLYSLNSTDKEVSSVLAANQKDHQFPALIKNSLLQNGTLYQTKINTSFGQQGWSDMLHGRVVWLMNENVQAAKVYIDPPDIGPLHINVQQSSERIQVIFTVNNQLVKDSLELNLFRLKEILEENGSAQVEVNVRQDGKNESSSYQSKGHVSENMFDEEDTGLQSKVDDMHEAALVKDSSWLDYYV